ncbi:class II aldolase/adducin family protein [Microbacterium sp. Bi121]|uniref:class II aldolase/adducin family protein n=1 Tax=Microbacterium sp. Bi121 TaxID=2822348 RepID=UPI001D7DC9D5|nr:class II aldolase/adducin family protein [Microbacterium sp. Bi121]CAH0148369.1 Methylthioribulose-1-phosphate dehydratase [Microbacterium sp. Bi121]
MISRAFTEERTLLADACRVLAGRRLADGILGHISLRVDDDALLVRCRGPYERGLGHTTADDIRLVRFDGTAIDAHETDGWSVPNELPIHAAVLRSRPDVASVVHAHPRRTVIADLAGIAIRPVVGAYDIPGAHLAAGGVPVYPRGVLVRNAGLAHEMVTAMHGRPVVILRAHGVTSAAVSVEQAVLQAVSVDEIAGISLEVISAGGNLADLPGTDLAELPDLGSAFNTGTAWRHEIARLRDAASTSASAN